MEKEVKETKNDFYYAFNFFTYDDSKKEIGDNYIHDNEVYHINPISFRESELDVIDSTLDVADRIEEMMMFCGDKLKTESRFMLDDYDDEGNYTDKKEEEHQIELVSFPGVFLKGEDLKKVLSGVIHPVNIWKYRDFTPEAINIVENMAYRGKIPMKISILPATFFGDHYLDLDKEGIDAREYNVFGIVDIEKLCEELKSRGISLTLTVKNINDLMANTHKEMAKIREKFYNDEITYEEMNESFSKINDDPTKKIDSLTFDDYLKNLVSTRMVSSIKMSMSFGEYLRKTGFHK